MMQVRVRGRKSRRGSEWKYEEWRTYEVGEEGKKRGRKGWRKDVRTLVRLGKNNKIRDEVKGKMANELY